MSADARRAPPLLLAAGGGVLYFLGWLGFGLWPLIALFLVPLWRALDRTPGAARSATLGLVFGAAAYAGGYLWLWPLVDEFLGERLWLGALLFGLHGLWFAAGFAVYALLYRAARRRGAPLLLAGVAPLLAVEWLQPQLFPVNAGAALARVGPLVQIADLGGPLLLSAFVGCWNAAAFAVVSWGLGERSAPVRGLAATALLVLVVLGYGALRTRAVAAGDADARGLRVGLVQANLGLVEKRARAVLSHRRHLEQTRALLAEGPLDLVVWPETAYGHGLRGPLPVDGEPVREGLPVPLLFGGASVRERDGRRVSANSAFLVAGDGVIRDGYDKNLLIPLAESLPGAGRLAGLRGAFPHLQDFRPADETPPLALGDVRISTPICYEVVVAPFVRRMVREARPNLLVTLANDAWFGDSQEPWIHLALARLRAVEHRLWLVRATNSGVSAVIDPSGRLVARSGLSKRESLRAVVHPRDAGSVYLWAGDWPGGLAAGVLAVWLIARRPSRASR